MTVLTAAFVIAVAVAFATEVLVRAGRPAGARRPAIAIGLAVLTVLAASVVGALDLDLPLALGVGALTGLVAMGIHDVASAIGQAATDR
jgi:hypothetical protein